MWQRSRFRPFFDADTGGGAATPVVPDATGFGPASGKPTVGESGFVNPGGDRLSGTPDDFADFGGGVVPPGGVPEPAGKTAPAVAPTEFNPDGDKGPIAEEAKPEADTPSQPDEQAAPGTEDAPEEKADGSDVQSPAQDETLQSILEKYETPQAQAKAIQNLQNLTNLKGEALTKAKKELEASLEIVEAYFEKDDETGQLTLRPDRAIERLQSAKLPPVVADRKIVREQIVEEQRALLAEAGIEDDLLDTAIENLSGKIDQATNARIGALQEQANQFRREQDSRAQAIANRYFTDNPKMRKHIPQIDAWLKRFPQQLRAQVLIGDWLPLDAIARVEHTRANIKSMLAEAYKAGQESRDGVEPATGSPASHTQAPAGARPGSNDPDAATKAAILGAGRLESIESLFGD